MKRFAIPLQTEVSKYMREKKGWPQRFCDHYAEKFWNHYQASGWKLSSGNAIKDWKACFNSQWQTLKFKEDIELLNSLSVKHAVSVATNNESPIGRLDAFVRAYRARPSGVEFSAFAEWYDFMKAERLLNPFTKAECDDLLKTYKGDKIKCRAAAVQITLNGYVNIELLPSDILKAREGIKSTA